MSYLIETNRLRLIAGTPALTKAAYTDIPLFSTLLSAEVTHDWPPELLKDAEPFFADAISNNPSELGWWIWYIILKGNTITFQDILIGNVVFKGPPNAIGTIEIGYALLEPFQEKGFATESVKALINWAFNKDNVSCVIAETFPDLAPSIRVMEKCGMRLVGDGQEKGSIQFAVRK